ncbi:cysteine desulfurase [Roseospira visakhapatnamensis]|uniref:Cysteine desulfurase n=1 Tax=Roseospira visakhapatnamensis TaxID=390880 RepID=A0A7W6W8Z3_9PROT|nr:cysteine desulfurase [Roseospira visakhapatnamensis]MBB4265354.1 cysteine desulfurase/selenocysteine lyase [Roseospira visakhapatnamensis]
MVTATLTAAPRAAAVFDPEAARADFPILARTMHGKPLVYLDTGASAQKPRAVLDAMARAHTECYANVHRGAYWLSEEATSRFEAARETVRGFLNAADPREIVFTANATDAINLVAQTWGRTHLGPGDAVLISELEHHANIVPWQMLRDEKGFELRVAPITDDGTLDMAGFARLLDERVKLVAMAHCSNVLGTILPVAEITRRAHAVGARVLLDGSQAVVHGAVDVQAIGCDFYAFTGHKLYGPTGIGVLYGRLDLLESMPPWKGGGDMIESVTFETTTFAPPPARFEAGTPPIVEAVGLAAAIDYVRGHGMEAIAAHEADLLRYAMQRLASVEGLTIHGTAPHKAAVVSFSLTGAHPHDLATLLDRSGLCLRAGHHCAQPLMARLGVTGTIRASFGLYSTRADVDALVGALERARTILA